jgi:hypothetical protein
MRLREDFWGEFLGNVVKMRAFQKGIDAPEIQAELENRVDAQIAEWNEHTERFAESVKRGLTKFEKSA